MRGGASCLGCCVSVAGGVSYQTSKPFTGDEVSLAQLGDGSLYMNGRGDRFPWAGHRTGYRSFDRGATWTEGQAVEDLVDVNCEAAMIAVSTATTSESQKKPHGRPSLLHVEANHSTVSAATSSSTTTLFLSEPLGPGRFNLALHCSCDGGSSWNSTLMVNRGANTALTKLRCRSAKKMRNAHRHIQAHTDIHRNTHHTHIHTNTGTCTLGLISTAIFHCVSFSCFCVVLYSFSSGDAVQYSALVALDSERLLAIWEDLPTQRSAVFNTSWCACHRR